MINLKKVLVMGLVTIGLVSGINKNVEATKELENDRVVEQMRVEGDTQEEVNVNTSVEFYEITSVNKGVNSVECENIIKEDDYVYLKKENIEGYILNIGTVIRVEFELLEDGEEIIKGIKVIHQVDNSEYYKVEEINNKDIKLVNVNNVEDVILLDVKLYKDDILFQVDNILRIENGDLELEEVTTDVYVITGIEYREKGFVYRGMSLDGNDYEVGINCDKLGFELRIGDVVETTSSENVGHLNVKILKHSIVDNVNNSINNNVEKGCVI